MIGPIPKGFGLCLVAAWCACARAAPVADRYVGFAHARDGGRLLYLEEHWRSGQAGRARHLVLYRCPDGRPFARKELHASGDDAAPDFDLFDARDGHREGVRGGGRTRMAFVQDRSSSTMRSREIHLPPDAVVDAGFDAVVRARWDALAAGEPTSASFLLPSRLGMVDVAMRRVDAARGELRLRMSLDAWYGFAAPTTDLVYRLSDRWLLRFDGIGSIRDVHGRNIPVVIEFPPERRTEVESRDLEGALTEPLAERCDG